MLLSGGYVLRGGLQSQQQGKKHADNVPDNSNDARALSRQVAGESP
jgi:hypothetical protein